MKQLFTIVLAVAAVAAFSGRAGAEDLTLAECISQAVQHSPSLASGRHLVAANRADVTKVRGTTLPYFSSQLQAYEINGSPVSPYTPIGLFLPGVSGVGPNGRVLQPNAHWVAVGLEQVGVTYPLFYQGSIMGLNDAPAVASARAAVTEQDATNVITEQEVIFAVVTDYAYVTEYREQLATQEQILRLSEQQLEIVRDQERLGLKLPQDVEVAQAQLAAAQQAVESARTNERGFTTDMAGLIGRKDDPNLELTGSPLPLTPLPPLDKFLDEVMPGHPALHVQEGKVSVAQQQLRVDNANFWPSATLDTNFSSAQDLEYFNGRPQHPRPTAFLSYLTVSIPIYDFGQRRAAINESTENLLSQKETMKALDLKIRSSIAGAYNTILQDAEVLSGMQNIYIKDQAAADLASAQHDAGMVDQLALVTAELDALNEKSSAQLQELAERLEYAELQNLSGGTWHWAQ